VFNVSGEPLTALSHRQGVRRAAGLSVSGVIGPDHKHYEPIGRTLYAYAAVQAWAQAVEQAGTLETDAVAEALRASAPLQLDGETPPCA
jgi:nicotinamide mononucleotide (NMN) deamidase PncC